MTKLSGVLLAVLLILLGGVAYRYIDLADPHVPDQLHGVWKTDTPDYADRYLELSADQVVVGLGENGSSTQAVSKVYKHAHGETTEYVIHSVSYEPSMQPEDKHEVVWALEFNPSDGGTLRLKNQPKMLWRKAAKGNVH